MTTNTDGAMPELPDTDANYWEPTEESGLLKSSAGFSRNTGPCPGWHVTKYYTADQMREYARAAIQQAAVAVPEYHLIERIAQHWDACIYNTDNGEMDIGAAIRQNAKLFAASLAPPKQQLDHLGGGECGGVKVPLTDERIEELADASDRWANAMSDCGELEKGRQTWQAARDTEFARNIEADHGITARAPRPEAPTSQINQPDHATGVTKGGSNGQH